VKTILLTLLLTGFGLAAQVPIPAPAASAAPAVPGPGADPGPTRDAFARAAADRRSAAATGQPLPGRKPGPATPVAGPATPAVTAPAAAAPGAPVPAALTPAAPAAPTVAGSAKVGAAPNPDDEMVPEGMLKLQKADADQVLTLYSLFVGRTILRPATLPTPQITFMAQTPLTKREAIQALDVVLGMNGIGMIPVGEKFVKAVALANVNQSGAPFGTGLGENLPEMGQYVTHIVQLLYAKPSEMIQALTPFASTIPNPILAVDSSQILILRDFAENVKRMLELIKKIDVNVPSEFVSEVIPIKYAIASDIAGALNSLSSGGGGGATVGSSGTGGGGRTGGLGSRGGGIGGMRGGGLGVSGGMGGVGGMGGMGVGGINQMGATGAAGAAGGANASFTDRIRGIIGRAGGAGGAAGSGDIQVIGQTKIISDERTNSLLIYATREDMRTIKKIIEQLDVVLAQVLLEAVIMEVTLDDSKNFGVSYVQKTPSTAGSFSGIGMVNNGNNLSPFNPFSGVTNATAGSVPGGLSYLGSFGNDLDVTVTALASNSKTRILQRPRIQTSHAVQASLFVGQSRPYPTGSYYGGGAYGGYSSIQQMQIGVSIDVTPLINQDGLVVMDIHTKIDSVSGTVTIANVGDVPVTSSKEAQAKVAVRDHDTIMLGGLIDTSKSQNNSGIPYLKDIPLLGVLFRSNSKSDSRDELIILIRPTVLPTPEVAALAARSERNRMPGIRSATQEFMQEEKKTVQETEKSFKGKEELELR